MKGRQGFTSVPELLKISDLCAILKVSRTKAYEVAYEVGPITLGKKGDLRVRADKLTAWIDAQAM